MVRAHAPRRAELRPRRGDDEQRRLRPALGQRAHEVERRRIGPVQVLEGEHDRLRPRPARIHAIIAASCRRRNSSGANFAARSAGNGISTSGASKRRVFGWVEPDQTQRVLEVGEALFGRQHPRRSAAGPIRRLDAAAYSAKAATTIHSTQVCGVSPSRAWNSSMSRDLPRPGSPTISTSWPSPCAARSQRRRADRSSSSRPTRGVRARAPPLRPPPLARTTR